MFEIEVAEKFVSGGVGELGVGLSSDNVEVNAAVAENGNVKFTITPKVGNGEMPESFFFRVVADLPPQFLLYGIICCC